MSDGKRNYSTRQILGIGLTMLLLALFGSWFGANVLTDNWPTDAEVAREISTSMAEAIEKNCEVNLVYRRQTRERTIANDLSTKLQVAANEALIEVVNEIERSGAGFDSIAALGRKLDRVNAQLNDVRAASTKLLPLPDCSEYRRIIEEATQ